MSRMGPIIRRTFKVAGRPTTIHVGGVEVARLPALIGNIDVTSETDEGVVLIGQMVNFFYIRKEFIDPDGKPIPTGPGTEIHRCMGNQIHVHEVLPRDQAQPTQSIGFDADLVRVHTRLLRTVDA